MKLGPVTLALLCTVSGGALADPEQDRIGADRAAANAKFAEQQRECATRFIVAACVDDARTANRETLQRLRQQELQLDEARRHAAAEGRRKAIAEKAQPAQARASEAIPDAPKVRMRRAGSGGSDAEGRPDDSPALRAPATAAPPGASRSAVEQRQQQQFEARQREAHAHRDAVAQRNAQRAASGKVGAPLPVPSAPR